MPLPAVAGILAGGATIGRFLGATGRFLASVGRWAGWGVAGRVVGGAAVAGLSALGTFFSRFLSNFMGALLAQAARPALIVFGIYFAAQMIYHFLGVLLIGFDTYVLGGAFWGSGLGSFLTYFAVLVGLDVILPLGITLLPLRIFWRKFTISL